MMPRYEKLSYEEYRDIAVRELGVEEDRVDLSVSKAEGGKSLNELDKKILQAGWPHIHGDLYGDSFYPDSFSRALAISGVMRDELEEIIQDLDTGAYLSDKAKEVLQAGWPVEHGDIGEPFKDIYKDRPKAPPEVEVKPEKDKTKRKAVVVEYWKDIHGKDYFDYVKEASNKTGASTYDIEKSIRKVHSIKPLSKRDKEILQAGWPHIYGKAGSEFVYPSAYKVTTVASMINFAENIVEIKGRITPEIEAKRAAAQVKLDYFKKVRGTPLEERVEIPEEIKEEYYPPSKTWGLEKRIEFTSEWTGKSKAFIRDALDSALKQSALGLDQRLVLEVGWPNVFGPPPKYKPDQMRKQLVEREVNIRFIYPSIDDVRKILEIPTREDKLEEAKIEKSLMPGYEQVLDKLTDVTVERITAAYNRFLGDKDLNILDRKILEVGWPDLFTAKGELKERKFEDGMRRAMRLTGADSVRVKEAVLNANTYRKLTQFDQKILKAGWPEIFGPPGTPFKQRKFIEDAPRDLAGGRFPFVPKGVKKEIRRPHKLKAPAKKVEVRKKIEEEKRRLGGYVDPEQVGVPFLFEPGSGEGIWVETRIPEKLTRKQLKDLGLWSPPPEKKVEPFYDPNADLLMQGIKRWITGKPAFTKAQEDYLMALWEKPDWWKPENLKKIRLIEGTRRPTFTKEEWEKVKKEHPVIYNIMRMLTMGKVPSIEDQQLLFDKLDVTEEFKKWVPKGLRPLKKKEKYYLVSDILNKLAAKGPRALTKTEREKLQYYDPEKFGKVGKPFKEKKYKDPKEVKPVGTEDEAKSLIRKAETAYARLTDFEKKILQSHFPEVYGFPGEDFKRREIEFGDYARQAIILTGATDAEVREAIRRGGDLKRYVRSKDIEILQAGWPHIFGKPGEHFKRLGVPIHPDLQVPEGWKTRLSRYSMKEILAEQEKHLEKLRKVYKRRAIRYLIVHFVLKTLAMSPHFDSIEQANRAHDEWLRAMTYRAEREFTKEEVINWFNKMEPRTIKLPKESIDYIQHGGTPPRVFNPKVELKDFNLKDFDPFAGEKFAEDSRLGSDLKFVKNILSGKAQYRFKKSMKNRSSC